MPATITEDLTYIRISAAAAKYPVSRSSIDRLIREGNLRARKRGTIPREVCVEDLEAFATEHPVEPENLFAKAEAAVERALAATPPLSADKRAELAARLSGGGAV
ncbi:hypothetical protein [Nesterenkonia jeotgali]|uniref:Helix-turn-helix domain-containing protein n=1 Tax=Nesterenkonia jeotgali TaxID=317018 RepID=A0A839FTY6_9MICC|nr:hypothetical protein [Nesterenkonia jeotgali]MBA8921333.1 hypothetical protein [Nesterenkonia jeotgali]